MPHNDTGNENYAARILIVDDEASIRFFLAETLERDGYLVVPAESGEIALQRIQSEEYDLALLDLRMKGVGGMEVIAALRQKWPDTVIIVLTAHASLETAVEALRQGAHDYLFKPCKTVELRESIHNGLLKRQQELRRRQLLTQLEHNLSQNLAELRAVGGSDPPGAVKRAIVRPGAEENKSVSLAPAPVTQPSDDGSRFLHCCGIIVDIARHVITLHGHLLELSPRNSMFWPTW